MSKVKLIIFAGCETAKHNAWENITEGAVSLGARAALGWTTLTPDEEMYQWSNRFNNCIALGYSIQNARNYANSFNYANNDCKNAYIAGNGTQVLKRSSKISSDISTMIAQDKTIVKISNTSISSENLENKKTIEQIIREAYPDFFFDDFEIDFATHEDNKITITVVENIGGFRTQNAYILFYEDGKITEIYDRTVKEITVNNISAYSAQVKSINKQAAFTEASNNISERYTVSGQKGQAMLDVETGEKYYIVYTTISTKSGARSVLSYKYKL